MNSRRSLCLLTLAFLALPVCALRSVAAQPAAAQRPAEVPPVAQPAAAQPGVVLLPPSATITEGGTVTFTVQLHSRYADAPFVCRIDFGDGSPLHRWDRLPVTHSYVYRQNPYQARAIVGIESKGGVQAQARSAIVPITVQRTVSIQLALDADPTTAEIGQSIRFRARIVSGNTTLARNGFELHPGDDSTAIRSTSPDFVYAYHSAREYTARVKLLNTDFTAQTRITVRPKPPTVSLRVPQAPIKVGDLVRFEAILDPPDATWGYWFYLEGNSSSKFSAAPAIDYRYDSAGPRTVYVEAGPPGKILTVSSAQATSARTVIQVAERPRLLLRPETVSAYEGDPIQFNVSFSDSSDVRGFVFSPGEISVAASAPNPSFTYRYQTRGTYRALVSLRGQQASSAVTVLRRPTVSLLVPESPIKIDDPVRFEAVLDPPNTAWGYRFYLDDSSPPQFSATPATEHRYATAGPRTVYVEAGPRGGTAEISRALATSEKKAIRVAEPPRLQLQPETVSAQAGDTIQFTVNFSDSSDVGGFVFNPGEKNVAPFSPVGSSFTYQYKTSGTYSAKVSLRGQEAVAVITISPWPPVWVWLVGAVMSLGVVTGVAKAKGFFPFKPSVVFTVKRDAWPTTPWPGKKPPAIAFSVRWRGSRDVRKSRIQTGHAQLIKTRRIHHD